MLYRALRTLIAFAVQQFFSTVRVNGSAPLEKGPLIIVANHPNALLDSLLVTQAYRRSIWFLAKSTLFRWPVAAKVLRALHVLPVYRRQDHPEESGKNVETFASVCGELRRRGAIALFPEGVSLGEREVQPLKTGAARMAFQAEDEARFGLGVQVQPVGITYSDLQQFRSSVTVTLGEPIAVQEFADHYVRDAQGAVRALTERIQEALRALTVDIAEERHALLVERIGKVYASRETRLDDRERLQLIAKNVEAQRERVGDEEGELESRINEFLLLSEALTHEAGGVLDVRTHKYRLFVVSPFVLIGVLTHYLPYKLIGRLAARMAPHPVYLATMKFSVGLVIFPVWYALLALLGMLFLHSWWSALYIFLILAVCGVVTNHFFYQVNLVLLSVLWPGQQSPVEVLRIIRDQLLEDLDGLRVA